MSKVQITIENILNSTSPKIIWGIISTEGGLKKWLADDVTIDGDVFTFTWGETWSHHEIRKARILEMVKNSHIRLRWEDETDMDAYLELRMNRNEITDDYILHITDFALPEDVESMYNLWDQNLHQLHLSSGL